MKLTIEVADSSEGLGTKHSFMKSWRATDYPVISTEVVWLTFVGRFQKTNYILF